MSTLSDATPWGRLPDGTPVPLLTLDGPDGARAHVTPWGATLVSLELPWEDLRSDGASGPGGDSSTDAPPRAPALLRLPDFEAYRRNPAYFGSLVGRFANRIRSGRFTLDGESWQVGSGGHHLHGRAPYGFSHRMWSWVSDRRQVSFTLHSPHGEDGFPGAVEVRVTYRLEEGALTLSMEATTQGKRTHLNLTHHPYFNLGDGDDVGGHRLTVHGDRVLELDDDRLPTGRVLPVEGTPFDLRRGARLGEQVMRDHPQTRLVGGFDHSWLTADPEETGPKPGSGPAPSPRRVASLEDEETGRTLHIESTLPVIHCFTPGPMHDIEIVDPAGDVQSMPALGGVALECQFPPDAPNQPHLPSTLVGRDSPYRHRIVYRWAGA